MTQKPDDLLPCPFCGNMELDVDDLNSVGCTDAKCPAFLACATVQEWNTRTRQPTANNEKLRDAARAVIIKAHNNLDTKPRPQKWACPWEELNALSEALAETNIMGDAPLPSPVRYTDGSISREYDEQQNTSAEYKTLEETGVESSVQKVSDNHQGGSGSLQVHKMKIYANAGQSLQNSDVGLGTNSSSATHSTKSQETGKCDNQIPVCNPAIPEQDVESIISTFQGWLKDDASYHKDLCEKYAENDEPSAKYHAGAVTAIVLILNRLPALKQLIAAMPQRKVSEDSND